MGRLSLAGLFAAAAIAACGGGDSSSVAPTPGGGAVDGGGPSSSSSSSSGGVGEGGSDAGTDAASYVPPAPCTRGAEAVTAPASLYDALKSDLAGLASDGKSARVDAFLADAAAQGGTPLEDPRTGRTVFIARGAGPYAVLGASLVELADTDLWAFETTLTTSVTYKLSGAEDPLARNVVWDGVDHSGTMMANLGEFNAIARPSLLPSTQGRLTVHGTVHATELANDHKTFVYFPPKYDDGTCAKLPTITFQDGNETLTQGDYATAADGVYAGDASLSAVLVFVQLPDGSADPFQERTDEYTFGLSTSKAPQYVDFLVNDLWPSIAGKYRVCSKARGISGASYGGVLATFAAFDARSTFASTSTRATRRRTTTTTSRT